VLKEIKGLKFNGISDDSRSVKKGNIFFAISGSRFDGRQFINEALEKGAVAIVSNKVQAKDSRANIICVDNPRLELARCACEFYKHPSKKLKVIGITGTNGKTTISYLLAEIFKRAGHKAGIIGTISHRWRDEAIEANNTTPGSIELQRLLSLMTADAVLYCAIEVSSHSLDQDRVFGIDFHSAIFTNLTREHLDYHKTFGNYVKAKTKLFRNLKSSRLAILNADDKSFRSIKKSTPARIMTYGIKKKADVWASGVKTNLERTEFLVKTKKNSFLVTSPLIGVFNIYNILAAICYALSEGIPIEIIKEVISDFKGVEGRLEGINSNRGFKVFIDYAHTDNALENVLSTLRKVTKNKLIVVFGCGGDRDKLKRPRMGKIASRLADYVIMTSDNPRSENPLVIAKEIKKGIARGFKDYKIIPDRFKAIGEAMKKARPGDIVLIAGKGHERYQVIGDKILPFSDKAAAQKILSKKDW